MTRVKGLGDDAPEGWALEEFEVPLPKRLDDIVTTIRQVLSQGRVQSLRLELGHPIAFSRFVKDDEVSQKREKEKEGALSLGAMARNVDMEEYVGSKAQGEPAEIFLDMLLYLSARRLCLTHVGVGYESCIFTWLGLDPVAYGGLTHVGGAEFVRDSDIPDDVMIFFASRTAFARVDQVVFALTYRMVPQVDLQ